MPDGKKRQATQPPQRTCYVRTVICTDRKFTPIYRVFHDLDITAGGDFLGLCDQNVHINMCPILDGYGVMSA